MSSRVRRFMTGPLAAWGLTLASAVAFAPSATAGCGGELVHAGGQRTVHAEPMSSADPTPAPCNGPSCSSRPLAPPAPATTAPLTVDRAVLSPIAFTGNPSAAWQAAPDDTHQPLRRPNPVYRPPR
jgi:hypothetical protein